MKRWAWLLAALAGCGREGPPPRAQEAPPLAAAAPDLRPVIVAFGDSLTAGFGVDPEQSYPAFLQRELDRRGHAYRVINAGVSGDTTTDGLARLPLVIAEKPEIVILEFGGNDGLRGVPVAAMRRNLERMIVELRQARIQVILAGMTLPPNYGPEYVRAFERVFPQLAAHYSLPLIPFFLEGVALTELMQRDLLHPTVQGNRRVAENVLPILERELKTASSRHER